jgi:hypothetical protein
MNDLAKNLRRGAEGSRGAYARETEFFEQTLDVFQAELDPETLEAVEPGKRFLIC